MNLSTPHTHTSIVHCHLYRLAGLTLLFASASNLAIACRYFFHRRKSHLISNRLSSILIGMFTSSFLVIFTGIPLVVLQCFLCRPFLRYDFLCRIHGFLCFSTGLFNMYIVALLSFVRYLSVLHKTSWLNRLFEQNYDFNVCFCALFALVWSLPPLFGFGNRFVREGVGFYCSLDWTDRTFPSRLFLFSLICTNYVLPFILLVYSNLRIFCTLRHLLKSRDNSSVLLLSKSFSSAYPVDLRKYLSDARLKETTNRLRRFKIDRRYALVTTLIALQYLIAWTPYACIELLNLFGKSEFIQDNPFLSTFCALVAKLSLILNPIILIYTSRLMRTS